MAKLKLLYFNGCPNHHPAVELLEEVGLTFGAICQDDLNDDDPLKNYTSPTLLKDDKIIFGSSAKGGGCSVALPSASELKSLIDNG